MSVEQSEAVEVVLMESWLDDELKCDSRISHPSGAYGHVPDEPASYHVTNSCGHTMNLCHGWVDEMRRRYTAYLCGRCEARCLVEDMKAVAI